MAKSVKIGGISFTKEGYKKFVSLSKEKQTEQVYNSLNPKDRLLAEKLLKNIPNGDISGGDDKADGKTDAPSTAGGNKKNDPAKPGTDKG